MSLYLDHNATSPPSQAHLQVLFAKLAACAGNPSSPHAFGRQASVALTEARRSVAKALGGDASEIIFLSGATEANNFATAGVLHAQAKPLSLQHVVTSSIEHPSILEPLRFLQSKESLQVSFIAPNPQGFVSLKNIISAFTEHTTLVTLMAVNNEIGTIQNVKLLGEYLHFKRYGTKSNAHDSEIFLELDSALSTEVTKEQLQKLHFHVDAVQALGKLKHSEWLSLGVDSCSVSAHKLGGLQGCGALFLRRGRRYQPLVLGGAQEKNRRAGTENIPGIVSFGLVCQALEIADWWNNITKMDAQRHRLQEVLSHFSNVHLCSSLERGVPNTVHFCVKPSAERKVSQGEDFLVNLDLNGFYASSGSACSSGSNLPSQVLLALGLSAQDAKNAVRISLSHEITDADVERLIAFLRTQFF